MTRRKYLLFFLISLTLNGYSQSGGSGIFQILQVPAHSRSMVWGNSLLAVPESQSDVMYTVNNPGLLNSKITGQYAATYGSVLPGVKLGSAGYSITKGKHNFSITGVYIDYGTMDRLDAGGNYEGQMNANEMAFRIGHSIKMKDLQIGSQLGYSYAVLGPYVSNGAFLNVGFHYAKSDSGVQFGGVLKNLGYQVAAYKNAETEPLPFEIQLGASYKPVHMPFRFHVALHSLQKWDLTYDQYLESQQVDLNGNTQYKSSANFVEKAFRHVNFGGELILGKHMSVLLGYNYQRRKEMAPSIRPGLSGMGWGIRMKLWRYHLTYSSVAYFPGQNSNTISLSLIPQFFQ